MSGRSNRFDTRVLMKRAARAALASIEVLLAATAILVVVAMVRG